MTPLKSIIIDDERHAREGLTKLLSMYCPDVKVIGSASNIKEGQELIENLIPDLVFLDIEIGEKTGFELLESIDSTNLPVIFTTAYSEFALQAFRVNAIDYLMKPILPDLLVQAVGKAQKSTQADQLQAQFNRLVDTVRVQPIDKLAISTLDGFTFLPIKKIIHVNGSGNYSTFFTDVGDKVVASRSLRHYQKLLPETLFFRCHQSHLINMSYIKRITSKEGNMIQLLCGSQIPLARSRKEKLMALLAQQYRV